MAKPQVKLEVNCIDYIEIDVDTAMVTVLERRSTPGIFTDSVKESRAIYVGILSGKVWLDGRGHIVDHGSELDVALWGIAVNHLAEKILDRFNATL